MVIETEQFLRFEKLLSDLITIVARNQEKLNVHESALQQLQQQIVILEAYIIALLEKEHCDHLYPLS